MTRLFVIAAVASLVAAAVEAQAVDPYVCRSSGVDTLDFLAGGTAVTMSWYGRCNNMSEGSLRFGTGGDVCGYRFYDRFGNAQPVQTVPCGANITVGPQISRVVADMFGCEGWLSPICDTATIDVNLCDGTCNDGNVCTLNQCLENGTCWFRCQDQPPQPCPGGDCGRCAKDANGNCGCF